MVATISAADLRLLHVEGENSHDLRSNGSPSAGVATVPANEAGRYEGPAETPVAVATPVPEDPVSLADATGGLIAGSTGGDRAFAEVQVAARTDNRGGRDGVGGGQGSSGQGSAGNGGGNSNGAGSGSGSGNGGGTDNSGNGNGNGNNGNGNGNGGGTGTNGNGNGNGNGGAGNADDGNVGHGNDDDGSDDSNPGNGKGHGGGHRPHP
jgi:hypothetical protein